jgi:hypothetical protein
MAIDGRADATDPIRLLAVGGAIVAAVGTVLAWAKAAVAAGASDTVSGYRFWEGKALLLFAAAMVLRAFLRRPGHGRRDLTPLIALGGLVIAGLSLWFVIQHQAQLTDDLTRELVDQRGGNFDTVKAAVQHAIDSGALTFSVQVGVYVSMLGGLLGLVGGLLGVRGTRGSRAPQGAADATAPWIAGPVTPAPAPAATEPPGASSAPGAPAGGTEP